MQHAKLFFNPRIYVTSEQVADVLQISLSKADQLLSAPETHEILRVALGESLQRALRETMQQMARQRWPSEAMPVRVDCHVDLDPLPVLGGLTS